MCDFADGLATTGAVDGEPAGSPSYNHARPDGSYNYGLQEPGLKAGYSEKTDRDGGNAGEPRWDRDFTKVPLVHPGTRNFITLPGDTIDTVLLASSIVSSQNAAVPLPLADMATPWEWPQCANRSTPQELPKPGACKEVSSRCAAAQGFDRPPDTAP